MTKSTMKAMGVEEHGNAVTQDEGTERQKEFRVIIGERSSDRFSHSVSYHNITDHSHESEYFIAQGDHSPINPLHVFVREPIYVNPCSCEACAIVVRNISHKAKLGQGGGDREYVIVTCDVIPYTLCRRIIDSYHVCSRMCETHKHVPS